MVVKAVVAAGAVSILFLLDIGQNWVSLLNVSLGGRVDRNFRDVEKSVRTLRPRAQRRRAVETDPVVSPPAAKNMGWSRSPSISVLLCCYCCCGGRRRRMMIPPRPLAR